MRTEHSWQSNWGGWTGYYDGFDIYSRRAEMDDTERKCIDALVDRLSHYDEALGRLRKEGGKVRDLVGLTSLLDKPLPWADPYWRSEELKLSKVPQLRSALRFVCPGTRLDIRTGRHGFPIYYLYRTSTDFFGNYSLVLEDFFRSEEYSFADPLWEHFVATTSFGYALRLLRVSSYRTAAAAIAQGQGNTAPPPTAPANSRSSASSGEIANRKSQIENRQSPDGLLFVAGRYFLDSAFHEDQRCAVAVASLLGLDRFKQAVELLYLCLGANLSTLRELCSGKYAVPLQEFFEKCHHNPWIRRLVVHLGEARGDQLTTIRERAAQLYPELAASFARFSSQTGAFKDIGPGVALYKVVIAYYRRLDLLRPLVTDRLAAESSAFDSAAGAIADSLFE